ncbi:hypothetical protein ACFPT7_18235 [Acidicapsa dinghuensis]|uniref:DUF4851 domain-containing protein n=1 Tax=Acidicapsa dinghuensis TaxID=2218256 RepID=A0ABW1ELU4_9BACT|nr:hypothetical protein [Acidicapsa dinghuensis]
MKIWQKLGLMTLAAVLVAGGYILFVQHERHVSNAAATKAEAPKPVSEDDLSYVKQYLFATFDQAKQLEGTTVWVKAGYSLPYFPYAGAVEWSKPQGDLPATEKLQIKKLIKAAVPAKVDDRVAHGSRQYLVVFTMPDETGNAKPGEFAAPIGSAEGEQEQIVADQLFYYDDPKTIYSHWPKDVWDAVAAHEPEVGMSEAQTRMAVGILIESDSQEIGNRTVTYHAGPKTWVVSFSNDKATSVKQG